MTPEVTDFIPGPLEDTDKIIEVADRHHITAKQKSSVRILMFDDEHIEKLEYNKWKCLWCDVFRV